MRPIYLSLKFLLKITLWIYYPRFKTVNAPKKRFSRTIFMSNHAASFMDPLVIASAQRPIVFFMTRADIYSGIMKQIFWMGHMIPIFREQDEGDTKVQNEKVFNTSSKVLKRGNSLLVFAEGFTDDVFIRRLKPIKKGAVRMGFLALEKYNWKKKIYVQAVGVNYSNPNFLGSDCLISNGEPICLNSYRAAYEENQNKVVRILNQRMEKEMQKQITDVRNATLATFHENIMRLTRKGMHHIDSDKSISLENRWRYSKALADWFNKTKIEENDKLLRLKKRTEDYFESLKENKIEETSLYKIISNQRRKNIDLLFLILLFPLMLSGIIFTYLPILSVKKFVEKSFKRSVFWGSVKMLLGTAAVGIYNIILFVIFAKLFHLSFWLLFFAGMFLIPPLFTLMISWQSKRKQYLQMNKIDKMDISKLEEEREEILAEIRKLIPDV